MKKINPKKKLPKGWRKVKLGEIAKVETGGTPSRRNPKYFKGGKIPWLKTQELNDGYIYDSEEKITEEALMHSNAKLFPVNTVLIAMYGATVGKLGYLKTECSTNQAFAALLPNPQVYDSKFLFYLLLKERDRLISMASGAAQQNLNLSIIKNFEIFIPEDINEQKRIADILSAFDDKIEVNNKIIKTLEEMAQEIFKEWFVRFRFPGWQKVKFVDSELGKIPEGWKVKKLGDILSLEYGKALTAPNRKAGNIPVYASSGIVGYHNEKLDNGPGIIVGRAGIPGSVYWSQTDFYCVDSAFYVKTTISKYFVYYLLKYQNLESLVSGSAVPGLNRNMVYLNLAVLPNIEIINKFEDFIKPVFLKIYNLKAENQELSELRDLLLPKLMSGELLVKSEE
jgi:type I restriction enzyme S subunit